MRDWLATSQALAAATGGAAIAEYVAVAGGLDWHAAPWPFVWLDVALVAFVAALPLAASLARLVLWRLPGRRPSLAVWGLQSLVLLLIPRLYIHARCQRDTANAVELSTQSRYGESGALLHRALALQPHAQWHGQPVAAAAARTDQILAQLAERVAAPLDASASSSERLDRVRHLAMLGKTSEALGVFDSSPSLADLPTACNLRGTIHESHYDWAAACRWYSRAKDLCLSPADLTGQSPELARAIQGVAFCERKRGRLREAAAAWQALLAVAPTAESHFLLAQFFEDTQQTAQARKHAAAAMTLDPAQYTSQGQLLLDKLTTSHFNYLGGLVPEAHGLTR